MKRINKMNKPIVKQKDARILRECLAWCAKNAPPIVQLKINKSLKDYADAVRRYCTHPDTSFIVKENKFACIDCGIRSDNRSFN